MDDAHQHIGAALAHVGDGGGHGDAAVRLHGNHAAGGVDALTGGAEGLAPVQEGNAQALLGARVGGI